MDDSTPADTGRAGNDRWSHWDTMAWADRQRTGSPGRKAVLMTLAGYADDQDSCYPSQATIADSTEQSVSTVARCLEELEAQGLIAREERRRPDGGKTSDRYYLLTPPVKMTGGPPVKMTDDSKERRNDISPPQTESKVILDGVPIPTIAQCRTKAKPYPPAFEEAWAAYPTRPNSTKTSAYRAWHARIMDAHKQGIPIENRAKALVRSAVSYAAYVEEEGTEPRYVKHAATFWGPDDHWKPFVLRRPEAS